MLRASGFGRGGGMRGTFEGVIGGGGINVMLYSWCPERPAIPNTGTMVVEEVTFARPSFTASLEVGRVETVMTDLPST